MNTTNMKITKKLIFFNNINKNNFEKNKDFPTYYYIIGNFNCLSIYMGIFSNKKNSIY